MNKLRIWRRQDSLGYPGEPKRVITVVIRKQREISPQKGEGDLVIEAEIGLMHFEDGGRDHKPGNTDGH